jgi:folate-binding protein YgfZ
MTLSELVASRADEAGDYHGTETAVSFGDSGAEWEALDTRCALLDMSHRRSILVTGEDREAYLQGQLSNDVRLLHEGVGQPALLLSAVGKVESMLALYDRGEAFEIVVDGDLLERTKIRAEQFVVADDVEFEDTGTCDTLGLCGPEAAGMLARLGVVVPAEACGVSDSVLAGNPICVRSRADFRVPMYELLADDAAGMWSELEEAGAFPTGFQALETLRMESGLPRYAIDVDADRIALEARLEWAIHFSKGCYVGQEVIERAVSRGRLNRRLCLLELDGSVPLGAQVEEGGENDCVTSVARSPKLGRIALAYISRDRAVAGVKVHVGGVTARVLEWPREERLAGR